MKRTIGLGIIVIMIAGLSACATTETGQKTPTPR